MIDDLAVRMTYWDDPKNRAPRDEHDLTDSMPYPFEGIEHLFDAKDVLEIGPGRGRQYERLRGRVRSYSVCDISPAALAEPVFDLTSGKHLLVDYADDFVVGFDVVHFWYVMHHIRLRELEGFLSFVARHLQPGGLALFNTPQTENDRKWYAGDGIGTTWMNENTVINALPPDLHVLLCIKQDDRSSGFLFVARKDW